MPIARARRAMDAVFQTDLDLKSDAKLSAGDPRFLLERLVIGLCQPLTGRRVPTPTRRTVTRIGRRGAPRRQIARGERRERSSGSADAAIATGSRGRDAEQEASEQLRGAECDPPARWPARGRPSHSRGREPGAGCPQRLAPSATRSPTSRSRAVISALSTP